MPLAQRVLYVQIALPSGTVTLDQTLNIHANIHKDALAIQQQCSIEVWNLSQSLRESLLSQFTAWNKRQLEMAQPGSSASYINASVFAGYTNSSGSNPKTVFVGQILNVEPISGPPNIGVRITLQSQQVSKLQWVTAVPAQMTFKAYAQWVGEQLGVTQTICQTSYDNVTIQNPSASTAIRSNLLWDLQNYYRPNVAAFIDNNTLIVKDQNAILTNDSPYVVSEFIDTPLWTEWGCKFQCLFDPNITLAAAVTLNSLMNPSLNKTFVITSLDYNLTSRDVPFYVVANANPSA